jgi:hypothetical protein
MLESPPEKNNSFPPSAATNIFRLLDAIMTFTPTILKWLAALGILKAGSVSALRAAKRRRSRKNIDKSYVGPDTPIDKVV